MSSTESTTTAAPANNRIGLTKDDYKGSKSTLCTGCGHDSISTHISNAFFQSNIHPYDVAKMSGIGCSSKTPAYFISRSHAFNSVHGRMPSVSTGVKLANHKLQLIGVSGDGDTASIGIGGFIHMIRRNLPICYIVANNGVYGLTKGQFSATSEPGAKLKTGDINPFQQIDLCSLAIELGCSFVARSFSGDAKQMVPLLSAAMRHPGTAIIDVISPCVTFNNHDGSTKSYDYVKDHNVKLQEFGFVEAMQEIQVDYPEGEKEEVQLPDGSSLVLRKLNSKVHDIHDRVGAIAALHSASQAKEILTGLLYVDQSKHNLVDAFKLGEAPLAQLTERELRPTAENLAEINASWG